MSHQHTRVQNLQYSTTLIVLALLPLCFVIGLSNSCHSLDQNLNRFRLSHWRFRALEANFLGEALALRCSIKMRPFIRFPTNNALCRSPKLNCTCSSKDQISLTPQLQTQNECARSSTTLSISVQRNTSHFFLQQYQDPVQLLQYQFYPLHQRCLNSTHVCCYHWTLT